MSTDEKPANCDVNSLFYELDTGNFYYFDGVWKKVGSKVQLQDTGDSGTIEITENDVYDVTDYDYADVNVPGVVPVGTLPILENGAADVTSYATAEVNVDYATVNFNLPAFKRTNPTALNYGRRYLAATSIGNYALFGGGYNGVSYSSGVDAYSLASYDIQLFPETKYSFNGNAELMSTNMQTITMEGPVVGYIKIKNTTVT